MVYSYNNDRASLSEILNGNVRYVVPDDQLSYEWKKEQAEELWEDLMQDYMESLDNKSDKCLLGPIVIVSRQDNGSLYDIVDGQQRIITLTLLFCAIYESVQNYLKEKKTNNDNEVIKNLLSEINKLIVNNDETLVMLNDSQSNDILHDIQKHETNIGELSKLRRTTKHDPNKKIIDNYKILLHKSEVLCKKYRLESSGVTLINAIEKLRGVIYDIQKANISVYAVITNENCPTKYLNRIYA